MRPEIAVQQITTIQSDEAAHVTAIQVRLILFFFGPFLAPHLPLLTSWSSQ